LLRQGKIKLTIHCSSNMIFRFVKDAQKYYKI
jgi:hypothetical protein